MGAEVRLNRDTTYFGISPDGEYDFGGGTAYSPVNISSQSGQHNIRIGDPLPDTLSGLLSGSPFVYTVVVAPTYFSGGEHIGAAAINRNAFGFYAQDTWKISPRLVLDYGLRYELYTPVSERAKRTSGIAFSTTPTGVAQQFVINPQPGYRFNLNGLGPRVQLDWLAGYQIHVRAGGGITTIPPNLFQDNSLTGSTPFAVYPRLTSAPTGPIPYGFQITSNELPRVYTPDGQDIFANGTKAVHANTVMDLNRYQQDLAALSPSHRITPLSLNSVYPAFGNAYLQTWTLGLERHFGALVADLHRDRGCQAIPDEFFQRLSRRGPCLCSVHPVRYHREHHRRLRHRERRHQYGPLVVPRVADLTAGNGGPRRPGCPGQLYVVQVAR